MVYVETTFPRGGTAKKTKAAGLVESNEIFGVTTQKTKKPTKPNKKDSLNVTKEIVNLLPQFNGNSIRTLGIIVMGYIKEIYGTKLVIQLPGGQTGVVMANSLSDAYTQQLGKFINSQINESEEFKTLSDLFQVGQLVYGKVIESNSQLVLTMNPNEMHSEILHSKLVKGFLSYVAVTGIEEHGYMINTGISNLRAFLPIKNLDGYKPIIGELIFCSIEKIDHSETESIALFKYHGFKKLKKEILDYESNSINLNLLLPCTIVKFTITRVTKNALEGTICNGLFQASVINNSVNSKMFDGYTIGEELTAQIVCVLHLIKMVYLTLNLSPIKKSNHNIGKVMDNVEVLRNTRKAIYLKLDDKSHGMIVKYTEDYGSNVTSGQLIKVKLLGYNFFDRLYVCSDDKRLLEDNSQFSIDRLQVNNPVDFIVKDVKDNGVSGFIGVYGNLKSFMHWNDLSMKNIKKGDVIPTKVISVDSASSKVQLSNRKEYFDDSKVQLLLDIDDAEVGKQYTGMVIKELTDLFIVRFFNKVDGAVFKNHLKSALQVGKINNFQVTLIREKDGVKKISCTVPSKSGNQSDLGIIQKAIIQSHLPNGVQIEIIDTNPKQKGFISNLHFSSDLNLSQLICKHYKIGDKLKCVNIGPKIYSVCDLKYYSKNNIRSFHELRKFEVIRGHIKNVTNSEVEVFSPIRDYEHSIFIPKHKVVSDNTYSEQEIMDLNSEQIVCLFINDKTKNDISCSLGLDRTWNFDLTETIDIFIDFLNDVNVYKKMIKNKIQIGSKIKGEIIEIDNVSKNLTLKLEGTTMKGVINKLNYKSIKPTIEVGDEIEPSVLWIDYVNNIIDLTIKYENFSKSDDKAYSEEINNEIELKCGIVLIKNEFVMGYNKEFNQMVFMPKRVHYNDFFELMTNYIGGSPKPRSILLKKYVKSFGMPIGFGKKFCENFDLEKVQKSFDFSKTRKRELENEDNELIDKVKKLRKTVDSTEGESDSQLSED